MGSEKTFGNARVSGSFLACLSWRQIEKGPRAQDAALSGRNGFKLPAVVRVNHKIIFPF